VFLNMVNLLTQNCTFSSIKHEFTHSSMQEFINSW
jgi:hypothetical protein